MLRAASLSVMTIPEPPSPYTPADPVVPAEGALPAVTTVPAETVVRTTASEPYFTANLVVLILSALLLVAFFAKDLIVEFWFDAQFFLYAGGVGISIALFVTSLVLRSKTKRAGGRLTIPTMSVVISSVAMGLILASVILIFVVFGLLIFLFTGGL